MSNTALVQRVSALAESIKATTQLIAKLARLSPDTPLGSDEAATPEDVRADLTADIQEALKQHEEELELAKEDADDLLVAAAAGGRGPAGRRSLVGAGPRRESSREQDAARLATLMTRVEEDIKTTRARYRRAQLQAKRNADQAAQRERTAYMTSLQAAAAVQATWTDDSKQGEGKEQSHAAMASALFAGRRGGGPRKDPKATQEDMELSATSDVTSSLRRTHELLSSEVSRSRFAQETLDSSNKALEELNERYGNLDSMLSQSRSLLNTLLRSNKSDTWYLETAYMVLAVTLGWLLFRRILYGPLWWFLWLPIRTALYSAMWVLGTMFGLAPRNSNSNAVTTSLGTAASASLNGAAASVVARGRASNAESQATPSRAATSEPGSLSESIGNMVDGMAASAAAATGGPSGSSGQSGGSERQQQPQQGQQQQQQGQGQQAQRGDGEQLRQRDEAAEPRNPKKRMMEEPVQQQQQEQREL